MRGMAGKTSLVAVHRQVSNGHFFLFRSVAREADFISLLDQEFRVLRRMGVMAGKAHSSLKRLMLQSSPAFEG